MILARRALKSSDSGYGHLCIFVDRLEDPSKEGKDEYNVIRRVQRTVWKEWDFSK